MKLRGSLQQADQVAFLHVANGRQWPLRRQLSYALAVIALVVGVAGFLAIKAPTLAIGNSILAALFGWSIFHLVQRITYRVAPPGPFGDLRNNDEQLAFELTADSVTVTSDLTNSVSSWDSFVDVKELRGTVIIFASPGNGLIIPRNVFRDSTELEATVAFIVDRLHSTNPPTPDHP